MIQLSVIARDWTHRPRKALSGPLLLKFSFPGTVYKHQLYERSQGWPVWQVMPTGAVQHPLDQLTQLCWQSCLLLWTPSWWRAGTAPHNHELCLQPPGWALQITNPGKHSPARSWPITIPSPVLTAGPCLLSWALGCCCNWLHPLP